MTMTESLPRTDHPTASPTETPDPAALSQFGQELHRWLNGMSLAQLARTIGFNKSYLSRVVSGARPISEPVVKACGRALGATEPLMRAAQLDQTNLASPTPAIHVPAQVPAPPPHLVGDPLPYPQLQRRPSLVIEGPPGVGKSAWAYSWAAHIAQDYTDGQLYADLTEQHPRDVLADWLTALGSGTAILPDTLAGRSRLWASVSAPRRLLIVIDGALTTDQVRALLPAGAHNAVIVTSRQRLPDLQGRIYATRVQLAPLPDEQAITLLTRLLDPHPLAHHADLLHKTARLCNNLPVALHHAADRLAHRPDPNTVLHDLTHDPLTTLQTGLDSGPSVRDRLDEHLDILPARHLRIARLLAHYPSITTVPCIAAALPTTEDDARRLAGELTDLHILTNHPTGYRMPSLLARALRERAGFTADEVQQTGQRWCAWWLVQARRAAAMLAPEEQQPDWSSWRPPAGMPVRRPFDEACAAWSWCAAHSGELPTIVAHAAESGLDVPPWWYLVALRPYLRTDPAPELVHSAVSVAYDAAVRSDDRNGLAWLAALQHEFTSSTSGEA